MKSNKAVDLDPAEVNEASLDGDDGRIEGVGENAHVELDHSEHATGEFEHKGENPKREVKKTKVAERHVQSKPGLQVAAERKAHVKTARKAQEANWTK